MEREANYAWKYEFKPLCSPSSRDLRPSLHVLTDLRCLLSGAAVVVGAAAARGRGDEAGPDLAGRGPVPQDLHPEARERQVGPVRNIISNSNVEMPFTCIVRLGHVIGGFKSGFDRTFSLLILKSEA